MRLHYGWVVVAAGALMGCVAIGTVFSLAVFLQPMSAATGWSRTGISGAMTIVFVTMGLGAFGWGALTDRFGPMIVVLSGGVLLGVGLALASRATSLLEFQLIYGVIVGGSAGAVFVPTIATVTGWFDTHRSLAVSLVSAGMGVAPMTISPFASWLISTYDWRTAQFSIAILAWSYPHSLDTPVAMCCEWVRKSMLSTTLAQKVKRKVGGDCSQCGRGGIAMSREMGGLSWQL